MRAKKNSSRMMLLDEFLPAAAVGLGNLVESVQSPVMDAYKPTRSFSEDDILLVAAQSFNVLMSSSKSTSFNAALTQLLEVSHSLNRGLGTQLQSAQVKRYQLRQPRDVFKYLCQEEKEAREWLEQGVQSGRKSYMVVELHTAVDPSISRNESSGDTIKGDVTIPVSTIATNGMDILGLGSVLDSGPGVEFAESGKLEKSFSMEGEYIFAVGYKKIVWKSWSLKRKTIEESALDSEIRWSIMGQKRGRDEKAKVVSLDLTDDLLAKDFSDDESDDTNDDNEGCNDDGDSDSDADEDDRELEDIVKRSIEVNGQSFMTSIKADEEQS